jgi:hypothetical protein
MSIFGSHRTSQSLALDPAQNTRLIDLATQLRGRSTLAGASTV